MDVEQAELLYTLKILFQCIERRLSGFSEQGMNFSLNDEVGTENAPFAKQVFIMLRSIYPLHYIELHLFLLRTDITADAIILLHMAHSIRMVENCANVFQGLLYSCCLAYSVVEYTLLKIGNMTRLKGCMHNLVFAVFSQGWVYQTYIESGGIRALRDYCLPYTLPRTLDFVGKCYSHQYMLITQFEQHDGKYVHFALESTDNIFVLRGLVGHIKNLVQGLYARELATDVYLRQSVRRVFEKLNQLQPIYSTLTSDELLAKSIVNYSGYF